MDSAIVRDGEVIILIECKRSLSAPTLENAAQLSRYFATTKAGIAVLTNGGFPHFYMDLDAPNRMDSKPFCSLT